MLTTGDQVPLVMLSHEWSEQYLLVTQGRQRLAVERGRETRRK